MLIKICIHVQVGFGNHPLPLLPLLHSLSTDEAHWHTGVWQPSWVTLDMLAKMVCQEHHCVTFFQIFLCKKMRKKKNKAPETEPGQKPCLSKWKASSQQSAPLASTEFVIGNVFVNKCVIAYKNCSISIFVFINVFTTRIIYCKCLHKLVYKNH